MTWAEFKVAVATFLTDRQPSETNFAAALAEFVRARLAREAGDAAGYALIQKRYTSLRRGLAGYQSTSNLATLQERAKEMLRTTNPTDQLMTEAVAEFVRSKLGDGTPNTRFGSLRISLAGYDTSLTNTQLGTAAKKLLRMAGTSDATYAEAVTDWVRAQSSRVLMNDAAAYDLHLKRYATLRVGLAGYATTQDITALKAAVRVQLHDGAATNAQFAQACSFYVRSQLAREVDARGSADGGASAMAVMNSARADYMQARLRLMGFAHTLAGGLGAEVAKYLPVDSERGNSSTYIATLIAAAVEDMQALGTWLDGQIVNAVADLTAHATWIDEQVVTARAELVSIEEFIDAQISIAKDDLESLHERVEAELRAGVRDLQHYIRAYTVGHETDFAASDLTEDGNANAGDLPDGAKPRQFIMRQIADDDDEADDADWEIREATCELIAWDDRRDKLQLTERLDARVAIDPRGTKFMVSPLLIEDITELRLIWDGEKLDFADDDNTPFDEGAAEATGLWINSRLASEWGESVSQAQIWKAQYNAERTKLYLRHRDRQGVRP